MAPIRSKERIKEPETGLPRGRWARHRRSQGGDGEHRETYYLDRRLFLGDREQGVGNKTKSPRAPPPSDSPRLPEAGDDHATGVESTIRDEMSAIHESLNEFSIDVQWAVRQIREAAQGVERQLLLFRDDVP